MFCELKCEDKNADGKNCGGWGFMTVFELDKPFSRPLESGSLVTKGGGVTYEGCYKVKQNSDIFNKFITSSEWMTNEVRWSDCIVRTVDQSNTSFLLACVCGSRQNVILVTTIYDYQ